MKHYLAGSLTRIADLQARGFEVERLGLERWETGDYVLAEATGVPVGRDVEEPGGRRAPLYLGDLVLGALGRRYATLEYTGDWRQVKDEGRMALLTPAGLLGRLTSRSVLVGAPAQMHYRGHVVSKEGGSKERMADHVRPAAERDFDTPVIVLYGTSMSAGKTSAARVIVGRLAKRGYRVAGAKLSGAGMHRDILTMRDAGAAAVVDFVDAGLPSTVVPEERYRPALAYMLRRIAEVEADVAVVEVGASPLEPYNGRVAIEALESHVRFEVLCASDPYAVVGVISAFDRRPHLVTGIATNTRAGVDLVRQLSGLEALDLRKRETWEALDARLEARLEPPGARPGASPERREA